MPSVIGAIRDKWLSLGGEGSFLGQPLTDELTTPDGVGRFNHFQGGSIYWTPNTGAFEVHGAIRDRWAELGWERSYLGYPTSDLRGVIVHYTGLFCFGETDWDQGSNSDEPYVILSYAAPKSTRTILSRVYDDVDNGEANPDLLELYRGEPYGINLSAVLMESDFGDPNVYRADVETIVTGVHAAGTVALGLIPLVGPIIAAVAGPGLLTLIPTISGAVNDLFNFGDDRIGGATVTLSAKQMVLLAARTGNSTFEGIGFKVETPLIEGSGASYKVYFGIVPA
jgi:hypothetical protein